MSRGGLVRERETLTDTHTHLFGGLLGAIIDPPAQAGTAACNVSPDLKLPCHRVTHNSASDIGCHLSDSAFQFVQHGLHVQARPDS